MRSVVCWLWNDGGRDYLPQHVNVLHRMFRRHLPGEFRFICITDMPGVYDEGVEVMPTPKRAQWLCSLKTPEGARFPSCYRRLWMFSNEARCLGDRVLLVDIDVLVMRDASPLFARDEPFVGWRPLASWGNNSNRIGGGIYLMTPGASARVWRDFKGLPSITQARQAGYRGSDQAWLSYKLIGCPVYGPEAGIWSIRDLSDGMKHPPSDAVLIQHNGVTKPWTSHVAWVKKAWC
jgi:hypothetical protein